MASADEKPKTGFVKQTFTDENGKQIPYVVYVPRDYDGKKAYPVIVYLHGLGEKNPIPWGLGTYIKARETSASSASSPTRFALGIREGPARSARSGRLTRSWLITRPTETAST